MVPGNFEGLDSSAFVVRVVFLRMGLRGGNSKIAIERAIVLIGLPPNRGRLLSVEQKCGVERTSVNKFPALHFLDLFAKEVFSAKALLKFDAFSER